MLSIDGVPLRHRLGSSWARARLAEVLLGIGLTAAPPTVIGRLERLDDCSR